MTGRRVVVATGNPHKLEEIRRLLGEVVPEVRSGELTLVAMSELGLGSPVEDGDTFEDNALIKARACLAGAQLPAIADDSGLEVDVLGGAPGVHSARYAGEDATDAGNNAKLVADLAAIGEGDAAPVARFVCAAAFVTPDGLEVTRRGTMEGRVVRPARGDNGFGYDPHFVAAVTEDDRTNGELSGPEKDAISHRGDAFRALAADVARWMASR